MLLRRLIYALALLSLLWLGWAFSHPPHYLANPDNAGGPWRRDDITISALQPFALEARVLGREDYYFDRGAALSPTDLALGWGPMADPQVLAQIDISQSNRWYYWRAAQLPIPRREIETHSANMHMIPANAGLAARLKAVRVGQLVHLKGQLVRADGRDGWHWVSSLSRTDTGDGSCEVIWVESAQVADRPPDM